ncbi:hypothetical protein AK812_SmicGene6262 [Symbiodinium microadriaticum]|uniref:Uncharacterized protein n=1 Tax=Symbiodinium microadriaticum TaxID=2951 RepID=A0A1Q9ERL4_SYMMI|nr:hypothetical protein AK812_SmicGene6262 [Symbiodinium microadriaticum]
MSSFPTTKPPTLVRQRRPTMCAWCHGSLRGAVCGHCLCRVVRQWDRRGAAAELEGAKAALEPDFARWSQRAALRARCHEMQRRLRALRGALATAAESRAERRRALEERRASLRQRRRDHEQRASGLSTALRRLRARTWFLEDPSRYSVELGAFHVYQELAVILDALRQERRRRCSLLVELFPVKFLSAGSAPRDVTLSLCQVQNCDRSGVLQEEECRSLEAAISLLVRLVTAFANLLDVTLPFPCSGGRGFSEVSSAIEAATAAFGRKERRRSSKPSSRGRGDKDMQCMRYASKSALGNLRSTNISAQQDNARPLFYFGSGIEYCMGKQRHVVMSCTQEAWWGHDIEEAWQAYFLSEDLFNRNVHGLRSATVERSVLANVGLGWALGWAGLGQVVTALFFEEDSFDEMPPDFRTLSGRRDSRSDAAALESSRRIFEDGRWRKVMSAAVAEDKELAEEALQAAVPEDEELAEEEAAPAKKRRRLVQQPAGSWLRAFGLWRDQDDDASSNCSGVSLCARETFCEKDSGVAATLTRAQAQEAPMWTLPSVLHPFLARWHHFSVCDKICTPEFVAARRLVDQDLLCLCRCQGVGPKEATPTLQLLATLLNSEHLGCVSPPAKPSGSTEKCKEAFNLISELDANAAGSRRCPPPPPGPDPAGAWASSWDRRPRHLPGLAQEGEEDSEWTLLDAGSGRRRPESGDGAGVPESEVEMEAQRVAERLGLVAYQVDGRPAGRGEERAWQQLGRSSSTL